MLDGLQGKNPLPSEKPVLIMDAGIASADNIAWLSERGYRYLVVSRERDVQDPRDQDNAVLIRETGQSKVSVYRTVDAETGETRLYCYSDQKAKKEQAIRNRFHVRLEEALDKLNAGLDKKGTIKNYAKILERIARLREKNSRVAQDYGIEVIADDEKNNAIRIEWQRELQSDQKDQHCGVYCLRTNIPDWSEEQLWTTYIMLTEIEATFGSVKTDLGYIRFTTIKKIASPALVHYFTGLPSGAYPALSTQTAGHPVKLGQHSQYHVVPTTPHDYLADR